MSGGIGVDLRTKRRRVVAGLVAVAGVLALGGGTLVSAGPVSAAPAAPVISWVPCPDAPQVDCGTLAVPLDYRRPAGPTINLALERRKADDQAHKIGSLFVNPGGPGGSGRAYGRNAEQRFGKDIVAKFDVIGFDPRGISMSTPLQCFRDRRGVRRRPRRGALRADQCREVSDTLAAYQKYTTACAKTAGPLINHMSTLDVAKDLTSCARPSATRS